ncbi:YccS family putative transporter [Salinisphaera hydrothermalis]|uniref:YccS/YhfK family integral membrane protein n=1 Tax=Salinisphaera hydrothermalis (strain C41B8) TaxID=1304275 RepID=A0A084IHB3_SALHC|nr:YccS family putative transporter [Salinisphaera hydrothermalis]KEZ76097.1 YccS/YhfK family integral membrane protein [Salinisphaera hydrothermalis C41B8]
MSLRWFRLQRVTAFDRFADAIRVLVALSGVMLYTGLREDAHQLIPLMLGVIASAIAETDDSWRRRARALLLTLVCFSVAALTVEGLLGMPWAFALALPVGTFVLIMLGAASGRFATIGNATLLLSVYTMIGVTQHTGAPRPFWVEPLLLVIGAAWYGVLALAWNAVFVHRPVRQSLARLYGALDDYLVCKSWLFEPVRDLDVAARRSDLAHANARVVGALNDTRLALMDRLAGRRSRSAMTENLRLYLAAQDIHERTSSAHYPYKALTEAFFHSDLMFRCQRLLRVTGAACRARAAALRYDEPFVDDGRMATAVDDLDAAIAHRRTMVDAPGADLLYAVDDVADNLRGLAERVEDAGAPDADSDTVLQNPLPQSSMEIWQRIRVQLTPASARFRHALRLALAMWAGYLVLLAVHPAQGYWILLTTMLVCQPDYGATRTRFLQRVGGTVAGLVLGWALMRLFPSPEVQLLMIVASGVVFFAARFRYYFTAAAGISVLVLMSFNQIGNGFDLIWPRFIDTLIGGGLAAAVMLLVLPDWRERELHHRLADALTAHAAYLRVLFSQYRNGRADDLAYRIARRDAHNADAAVSTHVATALKDPHGARTDSREALAVLACAQTLIGHLSTLGAHREVLDPTDVDTLDEAVAHIAEALDHVAHGLIRSEPAPFDGDAASRIYDRLARLRTEREGTVRLVAGQLQLLLEELPELRRIGAQLVGHHRAPAPNAPARRWFPG